MKKKLNEFLRNYAFGIIAVIVAILSNLLIPMIGYSQEVGIKASMPIGRGAIEWILWILTIILPACISFSIFMLFRGQGKLDVKDNECFIEAQKLLNEYKVEAFIPESPTHFNKKQITSKGIWTIVCSLASTFMITECVLHWNTYTFIATMVSMISSLVFGFLAYRDYIEYYTKDYLIYAKWKVEHKEVDN